MKKVLLLALSAAMLLTMAACADPTVEQPEIDINVPATELGQITEQPAELPQPIEKIDITYELVEPFGTYKDPNATELSPEEVEALLKDENVIIPDCVIPAPQTYESFAIFHAAIQEHSFDNVEVDVNAATQYATQYYQPAVIPQGYVFHHISSGDGYFRYWYVPVEIADYPFFLVSTSNAISITIYNRPDENAMNNLINNYDTSPDDDGYIYTTTWKYANLGYVHNGHAIEIAMPKEFGGYDFLRSLCEMEKVTLVAGVGVVDNAVVDNALAAK